MSKKIPKGLEQLLTWLRDVPESISVFTSEMKIEITTEQKQ